MSTAGPSLSRRELSADVEHRSMQRCRFVTIIVGSLIWFVRAQMALNRYW
jgi:hypothetical protein